MKQTFAFISPVVDSTQSAIRTEAYEQGVDLYNRGEYVQAFHSLLDYLNADFRTKYGNADGTEPFKNNSFISLLMVPFLYISVLPTVFSISMPIS